MKVKTIVKFRDLKEKKVRQTGEEFEVSEKRFKEINSTKFGILVEEVKEETKEKTKKEKKKK